MKKITLLALCALFVAPFVSAQEVTYVEDPAQGYLQNKFKDNWFISAEAGAGVLISKYDSGLDFGKRITPSFNLSFGKWFSPIVGLRLGADVYKAKGMTEHGKFITPGAEGSLVEQKFWQMGPSADVLINLTNWWCGYHPGRVYNAVFYAGFAAHCEMAKVAGTTPGESESWKYQGTNFGTRFGLLNTFALSKQVDFLLDIRGDLAQINADATGTKFNGYVTVMAGFAYKFKKREWNAPTVPVCPEYKYTDAEGDALVARLQAADAKISSLEQQLKACMNRPVEVKEVKSVAGPMATVYFPINSSKVNVANTAILKAVANVMKADTSKKYVITGWADSYTGTTKINDKLREARANAIAKMLKKSGVKADQIEVKTDVQNLTDFGSKAASLDRAVTISAQ